MLTAQVREAQRIAVSLVTLSRRHDHAAMNAFMSTITAEEWSLVTGTMGALLCAVLDELDETYARHGEPRHASDILNRVAAQL